MTADALYDSYTRFGEDPFIVAPAAGALRVQFSAWDYARAMADYMATIG